MKNKFMMTPRQTLNFVQKNLSDFVFNSMILARYDVTREFCENHGNISDATVEEIALANFIEAYNYLLESKEEASYSVLIELHTILMKGLLDGFQNHLTDEQIEELNAMINQPAKANTEIALDVMVHILDKRLFVDGDVRVALMFANKIMVDNGNGFITVTPENCPTFREKLKEYNETHEAYSFKDWLFKYCIKGKKVYY
ncbi:MAG: hypothetical protein IJJ19_03525 [Erysipelotrichaceae bacterium]|nr:hypothetical protein [Erysipelotrichaceae bacterium]